MKKERVGLIVKKKKKMKGSLVELLQKWQESNKPVIRKRASKAQYKEHEYLGTRYRKQLRKALCKNEILKKLNTRSTLERPKKLLHTICLQHSRPMTWKGQRVEGHRSPESSACEVTCTAAGPVRVSRLLSAFAARIVPGSHPLEHALLNAARLPRLRWLSLPRERGLVFQLFAQWDAVLFLCPLHRYSPLVYSSLYRVHWQWAGSSLSSVDNVEWQCPRGPVYTAPIEASPGAFDCACIGNPT